MTRIFRACSGIRACESPLHDHHKHRLKKDSGTSNTTSSRRPVQFFSPPEADGGFWQSRYLDCQNKKSHPCHPWNPCQEIPAPSLLPTHSISHYLCRMRSGIRGVPATANTLLLSHGNAVDFHGSLSRLACNVLESILRPCLYSILPKPVDGSINRYACCGTYLLEGPSPHARALTDLGRFWRSPSRGLHGLVQLVRGYLVLL